MIPFGVVEPIDGIRDRGLGPPLGGRRSCANDDPRKGLSPSVGDLETLLDRVAYRHLLDAQFGVVAGSAEDARRRRRTKAHAHKHAAAPMPTVIRLNAALYPTTRAPTADAAPSPIAAQ